MDINFALEKSQYFEENKKNKVSSPPEDINKEKLKKLKQKREKLSNE